MAKPTALPLAFLGRMTELLDEELPDLLVALNRSPLSGLRVNTLKLTPAAMQELSPWKLEPVPWCPEGFILPKNSNAGLYPLHDAGLYYIQEPSTMAVAALLAPRSGERVLDLAAAPGGKSTHLAALLGNQGLLVANDISHKRAMVLSSNLERWGARRALVLNETPERLAERWPGGFDRVLVDTPCSGEGMFRKNMESRQHWSEAHIAGCALRQDQILNSAVRLVRPGGRLVYATCTFAPEENEGTIRRFLADHADFGLEEPVWQPGFERGRPEWAEWARDPQLGRRDMGKAGNEEMRRTVRLWPHKAQAEGHFVALLRREGNARALNWEPAGPSQVSPADRASIEDFWQRLMAFPLPENLLVRPSDRHTAEVYALCSDMPDVTGLRALRPGWRLGRLRKGRFLPAHALALSVRAGDVQQRLDEPVGSELIVRYLRGETLRVAGPDGWLLLTVAGFPLGWGKRSRGVIKNHYPRRLRWL